MSNQESKPQDQTPPTFLLGDNQAKMPPEVNKIPAVANGVEHQVFPQLYGFAGGYLSSGPWSFHEHRSFEQGCILFGWGQWKDIQATIPGRSKDQCKSHGQKYLKHHPNEKDRLTKEHNKLLRLQQQKAKKTPPLPQVKTPTTKRAPPEQKAGKPSKKKAKKSHKSDRAPIAFKKEQPSTGGGGVKNQKFSSNSIDTICNDIYERRKSAGCKSFPLCLCEKTPCAREGLDYKFHVGGQALHSAAASVVVRGEGAANANKNLGKQNS